LDELNKRIWWELINSKFKSIYASILNARSRKTERLINGFIAVASSGSAAAWWFWDAIPWLWPLIIIGSQLLNILKPYIPSLSNLKLLHDLQWHYESKYHEYDQLWLRISMQALTSEQIDEKYKELSDRFFKESNKYQRIRSDDKEIKRLATKEWDIILKNKYGIKEVIN